MLAVEPLEPRDCPAHAAGSAIVWDDGATTVPYPDAVGIPVNVVQAGDRDVVAPQAGGGPRVSEWSEATHQRVEPDFWDGDPDSRAGVIPFAVPVAAGAAATPATGVPLDLAEMGITQSAGPPLTADQWQTVRADAAMVPATIWGEFESADAAVHITNGPITLDPLIAPYAAQTPPGYPAGYTYADAAGATLPVPAVSVVAAGAGSVDGVIPTQVYEAGHLFSAVRGELGTSPAWVALWRAGTWDTFHAASSEEAFALAFGRILCGVPVPPEQAAYFAGLGVTRN